MKTDLQAWLDYFENVLGVPSIIRPSIDLSPGVGENIQVLFVSSKSLSAEGHELLLKMIKAMKLQSHLIQIPAPSTETLPNAQYYICFSKEIFESLASSHKILTQSPDELLKNPGLKKKSWDDLQTVMRALNEINL